MVLCQLQSGAWGTERGLGVSPRERLLRALCSFEQVAHGDARSVPCPGVAQKREAGSLVVRVEKWRLHRASGNSWGEGG